MTESGESLASMGNSCDSSFLKLVGSMDAPLFYSSLFILWLSKNEPSLIKKKKKPAHKTQ